MTSPRSSDEDRDADQHDEAELTDEPSRMKATTMYATTAPARRAVMSNAPPARIASFETVATTSPVESSPAHGGARAGGVVGDDLGHPERGLEPVEDGVAVPHHAGGCLDRPEPEHDQGPLGERFVVRVDDAFLDRPADGERDQRLRQHPGTPKSTPRKRVARWRLPTQTRRRAGERVSGSPGSATGS